jgi:AcrR family transcriptional regulator
MRNPAPRSPNGHDRRRQRTRAAILRSAEELFTSKGYASATIEDIAVSAGVTRQSVYLHFPGKREIAATLIDELRSRSLATVSSVTDLSDIDRQTIERLVELWVGYYRDNVELIRLLYEVATVEPDIDRRALADVSGLVVRLAGDRTISASARAEAECIVAMMYQLLDRCCYMWLLEGWELDERQLIEHLLGSWDCYFVPQLRRVLDGESARSRPRQARQSARKA